MRKIERLDSFTINEICKEAGVVIEPQDSLLDVTIKMLKKQDKETLDWIYERFQGRTSSLSEKVMAVIEEERHSRTRD